LIGEILANVPALNEEYAQLLPSFLAEEPFERGSHWAIWRLAEDHPGLFRDNLDQLSHSLRDGDPAIRALAAIALIAIDAEAVRPKVEPLVTDTDGFIWYDRGEGRLIETTVAQLVKESLDAHGNTGEAA
jgi:hypothetical protein